MLAIFVRARDLVPNMRSKTVMHADAFCSTFFTKQRCGQDFVSYMSYISCLAGNTRHAGFQVTQTRVAAARKKVVVHSTACSRKQTGDYRSRRNKKKTRMGLPHA